ncbi:STAS domain-containing protein [Actinopolyspora halophila]|uniref:STAS domain-containing protein n=1 Tax=Actinopolyspora halophila TaxID=1850 RepID=UPI0009FCD70E|nr:STAS domain-containing protein [Actinopolyspora halophila]
MSDTPTHTDDSASVEGADKVSTSLQWHGRTAVLVITGEVDMVTAPRVQEKLTSTLEENRPPVLVVDLEHVDFFASAGLSALVAAYQQAGESTSLRVVAGNSATARPLRVTALDRKIAVYSSREEALSADR